VVVIAPRESAQHRERGTSDGLLIKSQPLHALSTDFNATSQHETQPNATGPHMEVPTDQLDLPEPSAALDPTLSRSLVVKRFVVSSPIASTIFLPDDGPRSA